MRQITFKGFYIILLVVFVAAVAAVYDGARIASSQQTIIKNQVTNATAVKDYIACLLTLQPTQTPDQVKLAEQVCFDKAPSVK